MQNIVCFGFIRLLIHPVPVTDCVNNSCRPVGVYISVSYMYIVMTIWVTVKT